MGEEHQLIIDNRQRMIISGVLHVMNYDEKEILLETTKGTLTLKGSNFNITNLSLENSNLEINGALNNLSYSEGKGVRGKGLLRRLLK